MYAPRSGRIIGEDGQIYNLVDLLGGGEPVSDTTYNINQYVPQGSRIIGEDGKVYNLIELLQNIGTGGGGGNSGPVTWANVLNKPTVFPPEVHNHDDKYYTKQDIDNAGYLLAQPDGETVHVQGGELKAKTLSGLQMGVAQLNSWLSGTDGNIQSQINGIYLTLAALSAGMRYRGKFEAKADLQAVNNKENGDFAVVLADKEI